MHPITYITPLLMVYDMPKSLQFYVDGLGFTIDRQAGPPGDIGWVLLQRDGQFLMLNTQYEMPDRPANPDSERQRNHGDTILYIGCENLEELFATLKQRSLQPSPPAKTGYGFLAMELLDPDGYKIVFQTREK